MSKNTYIGQIAVLFCLLIAVKCPVFSADCKTTLDCQEMYTDDYICAEDNLKCHHHSVLENPSGQYIFGYVLLVIISALANAGGLGGGAVIVPVYMFLFNFIPSESIPLSKATILAGVIMNYVLIVTKRSKEDKLLIDYGTAGTGIPLLLAGTMIGVMLTQV